MPLTQLPNDFDLGLIADHSALPQAELAVLRELAWRKAGRDPVWFLENLWSVIDPDSMERVPFKLRDYQHEDAAWMLHLIGQKRSRGIVGKARQIGWTTIATALAFHNSFFNDNHDWLIASQGESEAKGTLGERVKEPYLTLPIWFRERGPELLDNNVETMTFANGSAIISIPATGKAGRSKTVFGVLFDEAAWVDNADDLFTALDPLCYGPMIVFSTANGMGNFFHQTWLDSQRTETAWESRFRPWHVVPGRDEKWLKREKLKNRGSMWRFYQEYPESPDEMFAKSGRAVLPIDLLKSDMDWRVPDKRINLDLAWVELGEDEEADNELWVWEEPLVERDNQGRALRHPNYVISADIAEGLEHGDRTSIVVMNANTFEEAAAYRGHWPIEDLGELLDKIGRWYHTALQIPERNNAGLLPINDLRKHLHYPRIYRIGPLASIPKGDRTPRLGYVTNKATKPKMINEFIRALRNGEVMLHDDRFLEEAQTFIADGKGGFAASQGNYDDHVMGHLLAWQGVLEVGQYPTIFYDEAPGRATMGQLFGLSSKPIDDPLGVAIGGKPKRKELVSFVK